MQLERQYKREKRNSAQRDEERGPFKLHLEYTARSIPRRSTRGNTKYLTAIAKYKIQQYTTVNINFFPLPTQLPLHSLYLLYVLSYHFRYRFILIQLAMAQLNQFKERAFHSLPNLQHAKHSLHRFDRWRCGESYYYFSQSTRLRGHSSPFITFVYHMRLQ